MSNVGNVHQFVKLEKNTTALTGQRLVRLIAKADKAGKYASENLTESLAISIPPVTGEQVANVIDQLLPYVVGLVQDTQDKMIREIRIESGRDEIHQDQIGMSAVIGWLAENATGERVTREYLQEWFMSEYTTAATTFITNIAKGQLSDDAMNAKINVLRDMFAGWSSPKYSPNIPQLKAMCAFGNAVGESGDARLNAYCVRATEMLVRKQAELEMDALGFGE